MTTDAKHVENLAGLSEVNSQTSELSTAVESVVSRRSVGVVSRLSWSEPADRQNYKAEHCTDVTVSVHEKHMQVVSSCKAREEIHVDQEAVPATMNKSGLQSEAEKAQPRQTDAKHGVGLGRWRLEWRFSVVQAAICWCWSIEGSRDRYAESKRRTVAGSRTVILTRNRGRAECQSVRLRDTSRIRSIR